MNYILHYTRLVERARTRELADDVYSEKHHVVPKCVGGTDDASNLVDLTAREHALAHVLLARAYPDEPKLSYAAWWMLNRCKTTRTYEWVRRRHAAACRKPFSPERRAAISRGLTGHAVSSTTRERMRTAMVGTTHTPEHREKRSVAQLGRTFSQEHRAKITEGLRRYHDNKR